eukprot:TRINITY_DN55_c0_g1_i1.p1 TRINITY_DN55_c0_g1~~TRINITY_DN55_c0_g1_i1.p1  ORF type:complete len:251 (-),score=85.35 TRINITY_DN55_c0_g1_i1:61-813(-)
MCIRDSFCAIKEPPSQIMRGFTSLRSNNGLFSKNQSISQRQFAEFKIATEAPKLPDLPYDYNELVPYISAEIMEIHHKKHHQAYVNNYIAAKEKSDAAVKKGNLEEYIAQQQAIKFNGGGHINHSIFWTNLAPPKKGGGGEPNGDVAKRIQAQFGTYSSFQEQFNAKAAAVQGSGWAWLGYNKTEDRLAIQTCANQDPLITTGLIPLLGIDVWEHAYYLQYKNVRPDYLKAVWNVVNWNNVAERLEAAKK